MITQRPYGERAECGEGGGAWGKEEGFYAPSRHPSPSVPDASTQKLSQPSAWAFVEASLPGHGKASFDDQKNPTQNQTSMI